MLHDRDQGTITFGSAGRPISTAGSTKGMSVPEGSVSAGLLSHFVPQLTVVALDDQDEDDQDEDDHEDDDHEDDDHEDDDHEDDDQDELE
jgi:hypothetical protein